MPLANTTHPSSTGDFFGGLDGLRGVAVLSVVLYHVMYFNPEHTVQAALLGLARAGWLGVPIFFVLSGFLISYTILKSADNFDWRSYAGRRAAKILPPFLLSVVVFIAWEAYWRSSTDGLGVSALYAVTTIGHFIKAPIVFNGVYWSLFIEIHFYVLFPLFYFLFKRFTRYPEWATFAVFLLVPALVRLPTYMPLETEWFTWKDQANLFPRALDNFAFGILFSILFMRYRRSPGMKTAAPWLAAAGAILLAGSYLLFGYLEMMFHIHNVPNIVVFETFKYLPAFATFLLLFVVAGDQQFWLNRLLSFRPLAFLGLISYEWFLFHGPPNEVLREVLGHANGSVLVYLGRTALPIFSTLIFSILVFKYVSAPILEWSKRRFPARRSPSPTPVVLPEKAT